MRQAIIHSGEFLSQANHVWRVDIWRLVEDNAVVGEPGDLTFPGSEPVVIEWPKKEFEEPICGSAATIRIESPGDHTYIDLYTYTPGEIGVDIYRDEALYWAGTLDPEQYEEPYESEDKYDVTLTFQDFGILDRLKFSTDGDAFEDKGLITASDLLESALSRAHIAHLGVDISTYVSTLHPAVVSNPASSASSSSSSSSSNIGEAHTGNLVNPDGTFVIKPILQPAEITLEGSGTPTLPTGTTLLLAQEKATLATIGVQASNFIDDGEPKTLKEALEAILLPLGQRMIQRGGVVYVYDLNGLVTAAREGVTPAIWWSADSQTLATSKVASSIKITYDPNDDGTLMDGDKAMEFCPETHPWDVNQQGSVPDLTIPATDPNYGHFYITYQSHLPSEDSHDGTDNHFTVHVGTAKGLAASWLYRGEGLAGMCFKIVPQMGGSEAIGVVGLIDVKSTSDNTPSGYRLYKVVGGNHVIPKDYNNYDFAAHYGNSASANARGTEYVNVTVGGETRRSITLQPILRTKRVYVPGGGGYGEDYCAYLLRLKQEILFDPRFNPFTSADDEYNHKDDHDAMEGGLHYLFIPAEVRLYDAEEGGNVIAQYSNRKAAQTYLNPVNDFNGGDISLGWKMGEWVEPEEPSGNVTTVHTWLAYYSHTGDAVDSRYETTGVLGWKTNRHQIGATNGKLMADMTNMPDGEYMPLPPKGGWVEVTIYDGAYGYIVPRNNSLRNIELGVNYDLPIDIGLTTDIGGEVHSVSSYQTFRWMLYKHPTIEVADPSPKREVVDSDEVETEETVIEPAKEPVEIDTTCGTMKNASPSSRGQLYRVPGVAINVTNGNDSYSYHLPRAIYNLIRCGETATPERLLIRTLRQQYGTRRTMLSGEAAMDGGGLMLYAEDNQPNRSFILTGETQNVIADVSDCEFCEVVGDDGESANSDIIRFADPAVKALCVSNWGGNVVAGEITKGEAAAVTSLGSVFRENTQITSFNELKYFTGLTSLTISGIAATAIGAFHGCTNLENVTIPKAPITTFAGAFRQCLKLRYLDLTPTTADGINISALTRYTAGGVLPTYDTEYLTEVKLPGGNYRRDWYQPFNRRRALQKIVIDGVADLSGLDGTSNDYYAAFSNCISLTTITGRIVGISHNISLQYSPLDVASATMIVNGLSSSVTGKTLTLMSSMQATYEANADFVAAVAAKSNWTITYA